MKRKAIILTLLLLLILASAAQAMRSSNYHLDWMIPLTSGGGDRASSTNYAINYSIGQTVIGASSSDNYGINLGFWQPFKYQQNTWLPIITR